MGGNPQTTSDSEKRTLNFLKKLPIVANSEPAKAALENPKEKNNWVEGLGRDDSCSDALLRKTGWNSTGTSVAN